MRILYKNYISSDAAVYAYSENTNYKIDNLYDPRLSREYRTNGVASTEYLAIHNANAANYAALVNHNVSSSATVYIEASSSSGFTGAFSTTIPWSAYTMWTYISASTSYDWWRIRIVGNSTTAGYIKIGYAWLSTFLQLPGMKPDQSIENLTTARSVITEGGQVYGDDGYNYRAPKINFPYLTNAQKEAISTMWETVKNIKPVFALIWADSTEERPIYGIIDQTNQKFTRTDDKYNRWATSIPLREIF